MHDGIVRITLERIVGMDALHPLVERIVQEQIGQQGTYDTSLRRAAVPGFDRSVLILHGCFEPSFDVEPYPWTGRVFRTALISRV